MIADCKVCLQALQIVIADEDLREELRKINSNSRLSELFLSLARDLDVMEAKTPDEVLNTPLHPLHNAACTKSPLPLIPRCWPSCIMCFSFFNYCPVDRQRASGQLFVQILSSYVTLAYITTRQPKHVSTVKRATCLHC